MGRGSTSHTIAIQEGGFRCNAPAQSNLNAKVSLECVEFFTSDSRRMRQDAESRSEP